MKPLLHFSFTHCGKSNLFRTIDSELLAALCPFASINLITDRTSQLDKGGGLFIFALIIN